LIAEVIADGTIDAWLSDRTQSALDLCTGNGSLAVLLAMAYPDVSVVGSDVSADALAVAHINVAKHDLAQRITLVASDGLAQVAGTFDLIVCNPPYVNAASMAKLPAEYLAEPTLALASGPDGMDFCRVLIAKAASRLTPDGVLVLEIGNEAGNFAAAFPKLLPVWLETTAGPDQVLLLTREMLELA
jgi:ribosomal protein L3 glutamine methyltransferase